MSAPDLIFSRPPIVGAPALAFGEDDAGPVTPAQPIDPRALVFRERVADIADLRALVFAPEPVDDGEPPVIATVTLVGGGQLSGLRGHITARTAVVARGAGRISGLRGHITARTAVVVQGSGRISGLRGHITARYDINVERPTVGQASAHWQIAAPACAGTEARFQAAEPLQVGVVASARDALDVGRDVQARWQVAVQIRRDVQARSDAAQAVQCDALRLRWQTAIALRRDVRALSQAALPLDLKPVQALFQSAFRDRYAHLACAWQRAVLVNSGVSDVAGYADRLDLQWGVRWQTAWPPRPGRIPRPVPPVPARCYTPDPRLLFDTPWSSSAALVFSCERQAASPQFFIPLLRVYMSTHALSCVLLPSLEPVTLLDATISADDDGFAWSISASGQVHLLDQLAPVAGLPAHIRLSIDGADWVFAVEGLSRSRAFGRQRVQIKGRSVTALLGAPHMPTVNYLNAGAMTAQQLLIDALQYTGVDLDWQIPDWLVPAGVWSHQGTPLSAIMRVAESVGAVVRSSYTEAALTIAPRYAAMPWEWPAATPDVQAPLAVVVTDSLEPDTRPEYNTVYVSGQSQGVSRQVIRAGTAGDLPAAMVTDPLITHSDAARQRGRSILGAGGRQTRVTLSMPVLTGGTLPGVLRQGQLLEVVEPGETWRGLVRGVSVSAALPAVRQTLNIERHA